MQPIFSRVFKETLLDSLMWVETKRYGPKEFFGKKPDDELEPEYFIEADGTPRIPANIGDAFCYKLQGSKIKASFGQHYYNCSPLTTYQYILFAFGQKRNPNGECDNPLGGTEGFEYLSEGMLKFYRGEHGTPMDEITMETQNLGIQHHGDWGERNTFTERGHVIMTDLIAQKTKIIRIKGIKDSEHKDLETFLDLIEQRYNSSELVPEQVHYT